MTNVGQSQASPTVVSTEGWGKAGLHSTLWQGKHCPTFVFLVVRCLSLQCTSCVKVGHNIRSTADELAVRLQRTLMWPLVTYLRSMTWGDQRCSHDPTVKLLSKLLRLGTSFTLFRRPGTRIWMGGWREMVNIYMLIGTSPSRWSLPIYTWWQLYSLLVCHYLLLTWSHQFRLVCYHSLFRVTNGKIGRKRIWPV